MFRGGAIELLIWRGKKGAKLVIQNEKLRLQTYGERPAVLYEQRSMPVAVFVDRRRTSDSERCLAYIKEGVIHNVVGLWKLADDYEVYCDPKAELLFSHDLGRR